MVEWRVIEEFQTYEVSETGLVRNRDTGRILKLARHPRSGLLMAPLRKNGRQYTRNVHRIVAEAFISPGRDNFVPVHLDGDRDNNHVENLEWKTLSQAREYTDTRNRSEPRDPRRVRAIEHDMEFPSALHAARHYNGLERHVLFAAMNNSRYMRTRWEFIRRF